MPYTSEKKLKYELLHKAADDTMTDQIFRPIRKYQAGCSTPAIADL